MEAVQVSRMEVGLDEAEAREVGAVGSTVSCTGMVGAKFVDIVVAAKIEVAPVTVSTA